MSRNVGTAAASVLAVALVAGAAAAALWGPSWTDLSSWRGGTVAVERAVAPLPHEADVRTAARPIQRISEVFRDLPSAQYDGAIARSRLAEGDVKTLKGMLPEGRVRLAEISMSGQGQTISLTGAGLKQTFRVDSKPITLVVPYVPGTPVTFQREASDDVAGTPYIYFGETRISMQALIPGAEVRMSTPKEQTASRP